MWPVFPPPSPHANEDLTLHLRQMTHEPWDGTEVPGPFGLILAREPHLQQLLGPLEEMCTVIFHHETTDTQQKILNVGCNVYCSINPSSISYNLLRYSPLSKPGVGFL